MLSNVYAEDIADGTALRSGSNTILLHGGGVLILVGATAALFVDMRKAGMAIR
jgi:hypothetical protein